eukprot:365715-Chlamydomonas_euryale.AAC.5
MCKLCAGHKVGDDHVPALQQRRAGVGVEVSERVELVARASQLEHPLGTNLVWAEVQERGPRAICHRRGGEIRAQACE